MAFALDGLCDWGGGIKNKHLRWSQDFTYLDEDPVPVLASIGIRDRLVDGLFDRNFLRLGMVYVFLLRDQGARPDDGKILHQPTVDLPQYNDPHRVAKEIRLREGF